MGSRATLVVVLMTMSAVAVSAEMTVEFVDVMWDGVTVPEGQQCQKFDGHGSSPALSVKGIPATANLITLDFSDRTYQPMDNGGHGKIAFEIEAGTVATEVPSVEGHTSDLPAGFVVVREHQAPTWDKAGASTALRRA